MTIRFRTELELRERLESLLTLFDRAAGGDEGLEGLEAVAAESCLSLMQAAQVVADALAPKAFNPTEKLGETYLTSQERELFRARTVKGVVAKGCQIGDADVPAEESTTHSGVVKAVREHAHG